MNPLHATIEEFRADAYARGPSNTAIPKDNRERISIPPHRGLVSYLMWERDNSQQSLRKKMSIDARTKKPRHE
jgi:hypothetical protein